MRPDAPLESVGPRFNTGSDTEGAEKMEKEILLLGNPKLYEASLPVVPEELQLMPALMEDLRDTMAVFRRKYHVGRAIAAPQISVAKRVIYMDAGAPALLINPALEPVGTQRIEVMDDCMSFPDLLVKVTRFQKCRVQYLDLEWNPQVMDLEGDLSELLQHECDHLDGILATMRAIDNRSFYIKQK